MSEIYYNGEHLGTAMFPPIHVTPLRVQHSDDDTTNFLSTVVEYVDRPAIPPNRKERRKREAERRKGLK